MDFHLASLELPELLDEVVNMQMGHAQTKQLLLELERDSLPATVYADGVRLRQVLLNLISNALKFTEEGKVVVSAHLENERVRISVQDTGVGIKEEDLQLIFEKFRQSESFSTRSQQGSGLGLTLAKELIEHMDGEIGVTSTPGVGSTFYVVLPASPAHS
jgi:two-component system sensor histidine kinase BarA